ncbi:MAG TPA: trigger factor [Ktedonobacteraceae bacterium]|nr:trigger factor [Ktedonobacteraceae bacterium]
MKVSVEKLPSSEAVLEIDLTWDELEKASDKAYRKLVQKVDVQGFRRGKAPRSLLERKIGKEYIYQEGLDDLISESYRSALKEHELTPITQPELDAPVFEMGQPYHFSLKVPIITPVELGDYASLHFEREDADVTSEEVEQELEAMRNRQATWQEVERPAEYNDRVTVDLKLTVEDQGISDLKDNPFELTRERYGLFAGMDEHIVGMSVGESKEFTTVIPTDYSNEKIAGKEAHYAVTLYKVEIKEVPELDDAFASQATNGEIATLEDLRKAISDNILDVKKRRIRDELREKALKAVIDQSQITIHPLLIQEEAEEMLHQLSHMLEEQRMSLDQYLMMVRKTRDEYLQDIQPDAENRVKRQLVLDALADKESISIQPEEVEALFRAYAQAGQELPRSDAQIRALAISYRREKAIARLLELTTEPDPDIVSAEEEVNEIASAQAAALVGDTVVADIEEQAREEVAATEESAAPIAHETNTDVVE